MFYLFFKATVHSECRSDMCHICQYSSINTYSWSDCTSVNTVLMMVSLYINNTVCTFWVIYPFKIPTNIEVIQSVKRDQTSVFVHVSKYH